MLMSFPLFVVVVAVDSHWISKSLQSIYPTMLSGGEVTSDNYLEKIFQLPVWLDQPASEATSSMTLSLLGVSEEPLPLESDDQAIEGDDSDGAEPPGTTAPSEAPQPEATGVAPAEPRNIALATTTPQSINLEEDESRAIARLSPLLTRSPRALKRYLNTYRLLKALVDPGDLELARVLLAVATGRPGLGDQLFDRIEAPVEPTDTIAMVIDRMPLADKTWLDSYPDKTWRTAECVNAQPVVTQVRRFVFRAKVAMPVGAQQA